MSSCNSATLFQANEGPRSTYAAIAAPCAKSRPLISTFPSSVNCLRRRGMSFLKVTVRMEHLFAALVAPDP
jgi:hypothetical protein